MQRWSTTETSGATHLLLNGGKLRVPDGEAQLFLETLATMQSRRLRACVVERRSFPVGCFYVDVDAGKSKNPRLLCDEMCTKFVPVVQRLLASKFPGGELVLDCSVSRCEEDPPGVHLVFPQVHVTHDVAKSLYDPIIQALVEAGIFPDGDTEADVRNVVDRSVFMSNGLRMVGCEKGKQINRVYCASEIVYAGSGRVERVDAWPTIELLRLTSIRLPQSTPIPPCVANFTIKLGTLKPAQRGRPPVRVGVKTPVDVASSSADEDALKRMRRELAAYIFKKFHMDQDGASETDSDSADRVPKLIIGRIDSNYDEGRGVFINLATECQYKFCPNKNGDHRSSKPYFIISSVDGLMYRRCFSHHCPKYRSKPVSVSKKIFKLLWPHATHPKEAQSRIKKVKVAIEKLDIDNSSGWLLEEARLAGHDLFEELQKVMEESKRDNIRRIHETDMSIERMYVESPK